LLTEPPCSVKSAPSAEKDLCFSFQLLMAWEWDERRVDVLAVGVGLGCSDVNGGARRFRSFRAQLRGGGVLHDASV
jgi:hypothetical protein